MKKDRFIIKPFNLLYICVFLFNLLVWLLIFNISKKSNFETMQGILFGLSIFQIIFFILYRLSFKYDKEYINILYKDRGKVNWWAELPFNPCNIIMLVLPIAIYTMNRWLLSYIFLFSFFVPLLGVLMPCEGFEKHSLLKPRIIGFYESHYMLIMITPFLLFSGLFVPTYSDIYKAIIVFFIISCIVYIINKIFIRTGAFKEANYFFLIKPYDNPLLKFFHKYIKIEFLYITPSLLIFALVYLVVVSIIHLFV